MARQQLITSDVVALITGARTYSKEREELQKTYVGLVALTDMLYDVHPMSNPHSANLKINFKQEPVPFLQGIYDKVESNKESLDSTVDTVVEQILGLLKSTIHRLKEHERSN